MDAAKPTPRRLCPTPAWLVYGATAATGVLFASERWRWFSFNEHKGCTVLLAVSVVGLVLILVIAWTLLAIVFRQRMQFGLRTLLVFVTLCALVSSWVAVRIQQARRQAAAIAAMREGNVFGHVDYDVVRLEPSWLRCLFGDDFFSNVISIERDRDSAQSDQTTDILLDNLKDLPLLQNLGLNSASITDAKLERIEKLSQLRTLDLRCTRVTDAGLEHLRGLTQLQGLCLDKTKITYAGLRWLEGLSQLEELNLNYTRVSDEGLCFLAGLSRLRWLWLIDTDCTEQGVAQLRKVLPNCNIQYWPPSRDQLRK
jgi:hypothetical protein